MSSGSTDMPMRTNGVPSSFEGTAVESTEIKPALATGQDRLVSMNNRCNSSKDDNVTESSASSSSLVTSVSNPNVSVAWETTVPRKEEAANGGVKEKLGEFEAILASISHLTSPK